MRSVTSPGSKAAEKSKGEARWLPMVASAVICTALGGTASNAVRKIDIEALIR